MTYASSTHNRRVWVNIRVEVHYLKKLLAKKLIVLNIYMFFTKCWEERKKRCNEKQEKEKESVPCIIGVSR
jgi:hypothetical protein